MHYEFVVKTPQHSVTSVDPAENEWWRVFSETTQKLGLGIETEIFPAGVPPPPFSCARLCVCVAYRSWEINSHGQPVPEAGGHPSFWLLAHQPDTHPPARPQRIPLRQGTTPHLTCDSKQDGC